MATYAEVEQRRRAIPLGVIPYSQATISPVTNRRADCSGLLSYVWDLPTSGDGVWLRAYSTESLWRTKTIERIAFDDLKPGDAIGYCGPGTANGGGGHIALWLGRGKAGHHVWDHGSGMGPKDRWVEWNGVSTGWLHPDKLGAWRYVGIEEDDMTPDQEKALWATDARVRTALVDGAETIQDVGYGKQVPVWIVQAVKDIQTRVKAIEARPAATVDAKAIAATLVADPAFAALLKQAAFEGAQRAEQE